MAPATRNVGTPAQRRTFLGGSDAASVLGISPWRSAYQCWCEKAGVEIPRDLSDVDYIYFGHLLEPIVAQVFQERTGIRVQKSPQLYRHKRFPFIAGHLDRLILTGAKKRSFLECKSANAFDYRDWGKSETGAAGVPEHYLAQVDHYMLVLDCDHCYVAVLIGGSDFRWYRVERDPKREKKLLAAERAFWARVVAEDPPDPKSERDAKHRWQKLLAGTSVSVGAAERTKILRLAQVTSSIKELEKEEKQLRNWLFPLFLDKEYISDLQGEALARLTEYRRTFFDLDAFRKKHRKIAAKFTTTPISKRLKILI